MKKAHEKFTFKVFESYFYSLLPRKHIQDKHIVGLLSLRLQTEDTNKNFINMLNDGIELLIRSKGIRLLATSQ